MTVLVDTSVWVDHLRRGNQQLVDLLESGRALCHPHVIGELACGNLQNRVEILELLSALPQTATATFPEAMTFVDTHHLSGYLLWTLDRRLAKAAAELDVGRQMPSQSS